MSVAFLLQLQVNTQDMMDSWERTRVGGYNHGAIFIVRRHGIIIKGEGRSSLVVPTGATAKRNDQFAAGEATVEYLQVVFRLDALVASLGQILNRVGYSQRLHDALQNIRGHIAGQGASSLSQNDVVLVTNAIAGGSKRPVEDDDDAADEDATT